MIISDHEQYSEEWWQSRLGIPTASGFKHIITPKGEPSKSSIKYLYRLATERVTGVSAGSDYASPAMKRGHVYEPEARNLFSFLYDVEVRQVGLCYPDEQKKWAASPDGLFSDTGLEIFCPESPNAVHCLLNPNDAITTAEKYQQIQGTMLTGNFNHYFFISYYPGLSPLIIEVERDEVFTGKLKEELERFCAELIQVVDKLRNL